MLKGFKDFLLRGNVIDLAVAVVIGGAFGTVVSAFVRDLLTPLIAAIVGKPDFSGLAFAVNNSKFLYGEFINAVQAKGRLAMDVNPAAKNKLSADVQFFLQDSSEHWQGIPENSLDTVFASNFFEHLPDKAAVIGTLREVRRCLKPEGRLIALGPNMKRLGGRYWDFWDHHVPLTENSLSEVLGAEGFSIDLCIGHFLPFTMSYGRRYPLLFVRLYLALPFLWQLFGRQFLIVARK